MKIVVVGGVAGGASVAARIRRLDEQAEILILERGKHVSYSNCCLPYYLSGTVSDSDQLIMMTPGAFRKRFNIEVRVESEAVAISPEAKTVRVRNVHTGQEYDESYDKLVLSPGAQPIVPKSLAGADRANVFTVRNVTDIIALKQYVDEQNAQRIAVVGGGFIGLEVAENFAKAGKQVTLIEGASQVMAPLDDDMAQLLHKTLVDHGVSLQLGSMVKAIGDAGVTAEKNDQPFTVPADAVVLAIGVQPETELAQSAGLTIGQTGGIAVDAQYRTSDPDIYAIGDAIESFSRLTGRVGRLTMAGPAQRQARAAADHICGKDHHSAGYIGSSCLRLFDQNVACTGLSAKAARAAGLNCDHVYVLPGDKVGIMPDCHYMAFKLVFEVPTGRILGAQAIGRGDVTRRIDVIASMITMNADLEDLKELELCYSPVFGTAKDVVNMAALVGLNVLYGHVKQVHVDEVRSLVESGAYIVDVREEGEYQRGHLKNAVNIPLSQFRERMKEIPRGRPVYLHCRSSQRSYYAICQLQGNGWTNAINISGSYLGICLHEYYRDQAEGREPIVTAYNFN